MLEAAQIAGAVLILVPFAAAQLRGLRAMSLAYLLPNLAGSALLAALALHDRQWGFLLLEATWAAVSAYGAARAVTHRTPDAEASAR